MPALTTHQRDSILPILEKLRADIRALAGEDEAIVFQMRRYIAKRWNSTNEALPLFAGSSKI